MGFPKPRSNVSKQRAHPGQAASAPRKRARQKEKARRLANTAAYHGVTLCELNAILAMERKKVLAQGEAIVKKERMEARRDPYSRY